MNILTLTWKNNTSGHLFRFVNNELLAPCGKETKFCSRNRDTRQLELVKNTFQNRNPSRRENCMRGGALSSKG